MAVCATCGFESEGPYKFCPECGAESVAATHAGEQRKTVTVLFCDLTGSTALGESLDPERLRVVLARYFDGMKAIVERHGGTVEKFIGDAVMAVFGVPAVHEDDAVRAVRAASEMRDALPELGLEGRIGVMTGEVVTGTAERLVTGDPVNVAARLEQAAAPGEVLIGETTLALVHGAVEVEPLEPLELKGKTKPVGAYRLVAVHEAPERGHDAPFVGRECEVALLHDAWQRVATEICCELVTVIGDAGVGKSRLVEEALASLEAKVVRGRCLPYGEGITYWPVVEVLKQLDVRPLDEAAAAAIGSLLGDSNTITSTDEIARAFRKTLEHAAATAGPLVVVFDDIQWGEQTFHDLIEHVALLSTDAPLLLLCVARPNLVEQHPGWPVTLRLEPLRAEAVERLIPVRLPAELRQRIAHAAGGNPLFVGEMIAIADAQDGDVVVPPTLQALLAARLDQLAPVERAVLQHGAIEGEVFHSGTVQALAPDDTPVTPHLAALVRKRLIRPERAIVAGEDGFRFRHILLRDAAYDALAKTARAELHHRYATWLEHHGTDLVEIDEILGYHLEQACRYYDEVESRVDGDLVGAARRRLTAAGQRAARRQDYDAAVSLLQRAEALTPPSQLDLVLEIELGEVLNWAGRSQDSLRRAEALARRAAAANDRVGELCGKILEQIQRLLAGEAGAGDRLEVLAEEALPVFEAIRDDVGALYLGYRAKGEVALARGRMDDGLSAWERAYDLAQTAGHRPFNMLMVRAFCRFTGPTPVPELLAWFDELEPGAERDQFVRAYKAWSLAKVGRFDEAREILSRARAEQAERGGGLLLANLTAFESVAVELLADDPAAAVEFGLEGCRMHGELGEDRFLADAAGVLAQALYALDRLDEAGHWVNRAAEIGADDTWTQMTWRQVMAKLHARRGGHADAQRLSRKAVAIGDGTDMLDVQGNAYSDLAEVLALGGRSDEAVAALAQALDRFERKGNLVMAERTRERLAELQAAP